MNQSNFAINGAGRIGKSVMRRYFEGRYRHLNLVAINFGEDHLESKLSLLKHDSVHGFFDGIERIEKDMLFIRGKGIKIIQEQDINRINWNELGVELVLECTGKFNNKALASQHLHQGAKKIIVSAPCKDSDKTVVFGINHDDIEEEHKIISVGSCTTNCLVPIMKILDDNLNIESGFMTTIHSYTNDQCIIDSGHKDIRRSRAAALSIIPTSTGISELIDIIIPRLKNKIGASSIRVPTPNVSMIDFSFNSNKNTSKDEINSIVRNAKKNYQDVVDITEEKLVSIDFNHTTQSAIFDLNETRVINGNFCRVVAWYDNEWAFSCRVLDVANFIVKKQSETPSI